MPSTDELKDTIISLPLAEREEFHALIGASITFDHQRLGEAEEKAHLKIVRDRLAKRDAGEIDSIPFEEAMQRLFGKR